MDEHIIIGESTPYLLEGILSLPNTPTATTARFSDEELSRGDSDGNLRYPAVILVQGSGSSDRDETIFGNKPFKDIADYLSEHGIASARYDKRPFVYGKKMVKELKGNLTVKEEMIEDVLLLSSLLQNDPRIDPDRLFLLGHSLGGMMAPRIASQGSPFAGIIIMAGSPYSLLQIMERQNAEMVRQYGGLIRYFIRKQNDKLQGILKEMPSMSEEEAKEKKFSGSMYVWYFKEMEDHPTQNYLDAWEKPVLVMQGEKDFQVLHDIDFAEYRRLYGDKENFTFRSYPGLNHLFMPSIYGTIKDVKKEYKVPAHVDEAVLSDLATWITQGGVLEEKA